MALNQNSCGQPFGASFVSGSGSFKGRADLCPLHPARHRSSEGFLVLKAAEEESWACREIGVSSLQPSEERSVVADVLAGVNLSLGVGAKSSAEV